MPLAELLVPDPLAADLQVVRTAVPRDVAARRGVALIEVLRLARSRSDGESTREAEARHASRLDELRDASRTRGVRIASAAELLQRLVREVHAVEAAAHLGDEGRGEDARPRSEKVLGSQVRL